MAAAQTKSKRAKRLVIAEKPSVGRDLAAALPESFAKHEGYLEGSETIVSWSVGHLLGLADPDHYDKRYKRWRAEDLPIVPERFTIRPLGGRGREQLKVLKGLIARSDVAEIVNACDAGREGELIFAYIYEHARTRKPVRRLWLSSLTADAITQAFAALRPGAQLRPLEDAARSRAEADWLVGMNATRAATVRLRSAFADGAAVSLGRVQTPTLAILARREREIRGFEPEDYWVVEASFATQAAAGYAGSWEKGKRLGSAAEAEAIAKACEGRPGEISALEQKQATERPPLLYDLTTLQREASVRFGFTAKRTLAAAQALYERHKAITYPRTDSRWLPSDMAAELPEIAARVGADGPELYARGAAYIAGLARLDTSRVIDDAKVSDHHAIVPTNAPHDLGSFGADELKVYDLVARRFLAVFYPEARYLRTAVETTVDGADGEEHRFHSRGQVTIEAGWREMYEGLGSGPEESELPELSEGERVKATKVEAQAKQTKPPKRYTDASLLGAMETAGRDLGDEELREAMKEQGLGTPATRAAIIERLISAGYVERERRALVVTDKGLTTIELLDGHPLTQAELTGRWEQRLRAIESGTERREAFMRDVAAFTRETVAGIAKLRAPEPAAAREWGPCPSCGRPLRENRKAISCHSKDDPGCGYAIWKRIAGKQLPKGALEELARTGRTEKQVRGFRSRKGKSFAAKLAMRKDERGRWQLVFDEEWASK